MDYKYSVESYAMIENLKSVILYYAIWLILRVIQYLAVQLVKLLMNGQILKI